MNEPANVIRAEIIGDTCTTAKVTARSHAPVLALCRKLVEAGVDPATPLKAYRGDTLCLTVSSIGWGARHTVKDSACGTPSLARWYDGAAGMSAASPVASSSREGRR